MLGQVDEATKRDLLAACSLLVSPSWVDSFGIVFLEAWLYHKPVIAATTWGMKDVVSEGSDGLLVPFGDATALAQAIAELVHDPDRAATMGRHGADKVYALHTWDEKFLLFAALYQSCVERYVKADQAALK